MARPSYRILVLNSCRKWIGEAAHSFDLCRQLQRRGHQVILGCRRGYALEEAALREGLRPLSLHFGSRFSPWRDGADLLTIRQAVRQERIQIVHCHRGKDHWLAAVCRALFSLRIGLARTRHVVTPAKGHPFNRWLFGHATDALISVSEAVQNGMGPLLNLIPAGRSCVIHSAVDAERFNPAFRSEARRAESGAGQGELLIGLIGRLQNIKGQRVFLEAARNLAAEFPNTKFLLAGRSSGHKAQRLRARAVEYGIGGRVVVLDYQDDLPGLTAGLDVGVVASLGSEGSSRVLLEYLASGVPVVATRVGGIPELLEGGRLGLLVQPNDAQSLAEGIAALLKDPDRRARLAREGRAAAMQRHSFDRWIGEIEAVYQSILPVNAER